NGAMKMNFTISMSLSQRSAPQPAWATPAPAIPPMSACDDDVGRPHHQVRRSHTMAPTRPARITTTYLGSSALMCTIFDTVSATFGAKMNMATKLKNAAHSTAVCGLSTRVDTTVAIELAAS